MARPGNTATRPATLLADALGYLGGNISCIPIGKQKKPSIRSWKPFQNRRLTEPEARHLFSDRTATGVAVISGEISGGLAILDFDTRPRYDRFKDEYPALARSAPTCNTARGCHVWIKSDLPRIVKIDDGEFRGGGCYTLAPHSRHPSGSTYEWVIPLNGELPSVESRVLIPQEMLQSQAEKIEPYRDDRSHLQSISAYSITSSPLPSSPPNKNSFLPPPEFVVMSTIPKQVGERNSCLLGLARGLKFNAGLADADRDTLKGWVRKWFEKALPMVGTSDIDVTFSDFFRAFERARVPLGVDLVDRAALAVDPDSLPEAAMQYEGIHARQLVGLCHALATMNPDRRFWLSCADASDRLSISAMEAWRLFRMLEADRVIEALQRGNERRATRYRWIGRESE